MQQDEGLERKTVAIDFDGVLAHREENWPITKIGPPIPHGIKLAKKLKAHGYRVCILTARPEELHPQIALWLHKQGFIPDAVTNVKPPALAYIDDRAVPFKETQEYGVKGQKWGVKKGEKKPKAEFEILTDEEYEREVVGEATRIYERWKKRGGGLGRGKPKSYLTGKMPRKVEWAVGILQKYRKPKEAQEHGVKGMKWGVRRSKDKGQSARVQRALKTYKPVTKEKYAIAMKSEKAVSKIIGGKDLPDNEAFDVISNKFAVEVKTIVDKTANPKITVHPSSRRRKEKEARRLGLDILTVAVDLRSGKPQYYVREGIGAFRLHKMRKLKSLEELRKL